MILSRSPRCSTASGFTLIEIALSILIISTALLAIVALLPMGSEAGRKASDKTIIALILENIHSGLEGQELIPTSDPFIFNFDGEGRLVDVAAVGVDPRYLAEVSLTSIEPSLLPPHVGEMLAARVSLFWPVDPLTGDKLPAGSPPDKIVTYYVTPMTSPSWGTVDANFVPKIEF